MHPILGLTGLPGSGKSTVAQLLSARGAHVIDVDKVGHGVLEEEAIRDRLRGAWGEEIAPPGKPVDRGALARMVFADEVAFARLEGIVHPRMVELVLAEARRAAIGAPVVIDAAVLHRMGLAAHCGKVLRVDAAYARRWRRVRGRGWNESEFKRRERRMVIVLEPYRDRVDVVINNDGSRPGLREKVDRFWKEWGHAS